jgi:hypothetical protein
MGAHGVNNRRGRAGGHALIIVRELMEAAPPPARAPLLGNFLP